LSGCINSATLVNVKPDGSGTIEQTLLVNPQALKLLGGGDPQAQTKSPGGVLNDAEFKRTAERMGVRPVSLTPMKDGGMEGAKAIFAFDDISKVRVDQDPQVGGSRSPSSNNPIKFAMTRQGDASVLTITVDEKIASDAAQKSAGGANMTMPTLDSAMLGMIKQMFQGMRIAIDLQVDGTIVKTNADYVNGSRITLLELDVATLLADESKLQALQGKLGPGMSISDVRPLLKDIKGVKVNHPSLTIEFR
jgi:hypothetical protein